MTTNSPIKNIYKKINRVFNNLVIGFGRWGVRFKYRREIKAKLKQLAVPPLSKEQEKKAKAYYASFGFKNLKTHWHRYYTHYYGQFCKEYLPDDLFYSIIEHKLNRFEFSHLQDKNILDRVFQGVIQPNTVVKNCNGFFMKGTDIISLDQAISVTSPYDFLIVKPTIDTGGGRGVQKVKINGPVLKNLVKEYQKDFIVQEVIQQSETVSMLNSSTVNTLRISTYLNGNGAHVLGTVIRIGRKGKAADNMHSGGMACKVNDDGTLQAVAYTVSKEPITVTDEGTVLKDFTIPNYKKVKETVIMLHKQVPYFKVVSWDMALNHENQPVLVEFNVFGQGTDFQCHTGPFFGKFTDEVLQLASSKG